MRQVPSFLIHLGAVRRRVVTHGRRSVTQAQSVMVTPIGLRTGLTRRPGFGPRHLVKRSVPYRESDRLWNISDKSLAGGSRSPGG
jgi:hypothetical protein